MSVFQEFQEHDVTNEMLEMLEELNIVKAEPAIEQSCLLQDKHNAVVVSEVKDTSSTTATLVLRASQVPSCARRNNITRR